MSNPLKSSRFEKVGAWLALNLSTSGDESITSAGAFATPSDEELAAMLEGRLDSTRR